uniref:Uncharacterized protein n=1 Tax=Arion vulgaris TaxID=1028688 RepID=A0A0B7AVE9_9EUPU
MVNALACYVHSLRIKFPSGVQIFLAMTAFRSAQSQVGPRETLGSTDIQLQSLCFVEYSQQVACPICEKGLITYGEKSGARKSIIYLETTTETEQINL